MICARHECRMDHMKVNLGDLQQGQRREITFCRWIDHSQRPVDRDRVDPLGVFSTVQKVALVEEMPRVGELASNQVVACLQLTSTRSRSVQAKVVGGSSRIANAHCSKEQWPPFHRHIVMDSERIAKMASHSASNTTTPDVI